MKKTDVSVIIVSHNNRDILKDCIDSVKKQTYMDHKTYVLDNDSTDQTQEFIEKQYPKIKFLDIPQQGPSKKRNMGFSMSDSRYVVVMDSDARITPNWIKKAVEYMENHQDVGLCSGKILNKKNLIDSAGGVIAKNCGGTDIGYGEKDSGQYNNFKRVGYLKSASLMIRRRMIDEIGGFDEDYFFGMEDTDLGLRANISGWKVIYNPDLISYHLSHYTMEKSPKKIELFRDKRNKMVTFIKNFQLKTILLYFPLLIADFFYTFCFKKYGFEIFRSVLWNLKNIKKTLRKREEIQKTRKISDSQMFDLVDFPLLIRVRNIKNKYFEFIKNIKKKNLNGITFFITTRCNSKCIHCFYWKNLNKKRDLNLKEIEKIISKFNNLSSVLLSGGEPFIRNDLDKVIDIIIKYTNPQLFSIPTNCLLKNKMIADMEKILKKHPRVDFAIDCSLDGLEKDHDVIRGIKGSFQKTINVIKELNQLRKKYPNFKFVTVNTVITNRNSDTLSELIEIVKTFDVSDHFFDLMRGEHPGILKLPEINKIKKINSLRYNARRYYNAKKHRSILKKNYANLRDRHIIITQTEILEGKKWPFKCNAGIRDLILESDGNLKICELNPKVGSLLEDTPENLLKSKESNTIFDMIEKHQCDCTHICNLSSSMSHSLKDILIARPIFDSFKRFKYLK